MEFSLPSDEVLAIVVPVLVYWLYSGLYMMLGSLEKYRLHTKEEEDVKNLVPKGEVVKVVLFQQLMHSVAGFIAFKITEHGTKMPTAHGGSDTVVMIAKQFFIGMFVLDTWMYFTHRYMHLNKIMYRHIHSWHHRLIVPYAFGSQYNHPVEGLLMDIVGGTLAFLISGMSPRTSIFFSSFSVMKGIDDHCGLWLPGNVFHLFFWNNTAYHDVHHQLYGNKYNFSQPFFITWDKILGTHMPYTLEKRAAGGLEARPMKR